MKKKIVFLTGTRADYGKMKSLMRKVNESQYFELYIYATGMHVEEKFGFTVEEIIKDGFTQISSVSNTTGTNDNMAEKISKTISSFTTFTSSIKPQMIVIHGDRLEALAGAIVGSFNNILTVHIEGGEKSGTIDEIIRHSVTKLSHYHFVSSKDAQTRVINLGESKKSIKIFGSPDHEIMLENKVDLDTVKKHYDIYFDSFSILIWHPVTTELETLRYQTREVIKAIKESKDNFVIIHPNNDSGREIIMDELSTVLKESKFVDFPSMRFEYFCTILKNSNYIIGNSSAGIRESPVFGVPSINIGSRQNGRDSSELVINSKPSSLLILDAISKAKEIKRESIQVYGSNLNSSEIFLDTLKSKEIWATDLQKKITY